MRRKRKRKGKRRHLRYCILYCIGLGGSGCQAGKNIVFAVLVFSGKGDGKAEDLVSAGEAARSRCSRDGAANDQRQ